MKPLIILLIFSIVLFLGCVTNTQDQAKQQYISLSQKSILDPHNYYAQYEYVTANPNETAKIDQMNLFVLSDMNKLDMKLEFSASMAISKDPINTQIFFLSEFNKSYICLNGKCTEAPSTQNSNPFPTKEQLEKTITDANLTIKLMPKVADFPEEASCFEVVGQNMVNCYLNDGVIAYFGGTDGKGYMKLKTIQRNILTDNNFLLPSVPIK